MSFLEAERQANRDLDAARAAAADPLCRICMGKGSTQGYIGPGKTATYACPCTGMADWQ